ncbi:ABC transporter permease [Bifidobacterium tsurumiense]|uniref:Permease domain protein n=1 Tax=Bifidobacterium tsurumiense TaxID=356829 RepID=A0A087ECR6_9BIFI|nr:ABC transporter permease [Bifidobacterium tsurumiense]KFJ05567.1 Permease domain protein [Bifidobacterium tsurumiense]MDY4678516.1 FtsX-like permease family protein [Bifidobacterium tsurumiense]
MFFLRMVYRSFSRQLRRRLLIAVTVCLSASIAVAMLGIVFDVGDKLNAELSTYGSNIVVQPKSDAVVSELYGGDQSGTAASSSGQDPTAFLAESEVPKLKTIFWAYNITNFAPELTIHVDVTTGSAKSEQVPLVGTWFNKTLNLNSGETTVVGVQGMRSWWSVEGNWPKDDTAQAMLGKDLATRLDVSVGQSIQLSKNDASQSIQVVGIFDSGDDDNSAIYLPSSVAQTLAGLPDQINRIEVKALTTPENDLARKAAKNPAALSQDEWETWYCTAYPSSIAYQIEEVLPDAVAKQVRQVAALQGNVLNKTSAVMILMTALSLLAAAVAVANLMAASISERSAELALLKAVGATDGAVSRLMLMETATISLVGAIVGSILGVGVAQIVGHVVFGSGVTMRPMVFILVFVLLAVTVLAASASTIRSILHVHPAEVLHGR